MIDSFELIRDIYKVEDTEYRKTLSQLIELLNISEIVRTPARQLSLGQRMRCEIAASLLHSPKILFLDVNCSILFAVYSVYDVREMERNRTAYTAGRKKCVSC